ncbi:MAG TPA: UDP-glucose 4-epimerase GalE [Parachlamydiaceae bacterium]|nr:UDP-glucose 4-epimerase GalE [Parachlamydiaceae bacterium]
MTLPNILVVGGAGYIGSHVAKMLSLNNYHPIIFDNLSTGNEKAVTCGTLIKGDLANLQDLEEVFRNHHITAVMHFAALIDIGESVNNPLKYYTHNVTYSLNLLETMQKFGVKTLIFSSSAAIFGYPDEVPMPEDHACRPISPYGQTKLIVEKILEDCENAYGIRSSCLRYFNAAGGDPKGEIKNHKQRETNLIPLILRSLKDPNSHITIFGTDYPGIDGTCIRDYIHLEDLGSAHIRAMEKLLQGGKSTNYNLGNGNGFSVRQVIAAAEETTGLKVNVVEGPRRPGDPPILVADACKARTELNWNPVYPDLKEMISHAWMALEKV